jgi:hypothetical protein
MLARKGTKINKGKQSTRGKNKQYERFYKSFKNTKFYEDFFKDANFGGGSQNFENMYQKWKTQRKVKKEEKTYKEYKPGPESPFRPENRAKMMGILGRYTNFFRIININRAKTDKLFMDALASFKRRPNKETINRGTL